MDVLHSNAFGVEMYAFLLLPAIAKIYISLPQAAELLRNRTQESGLKVLFVLLVGMSCLI